MVEIFCSVWARSHKNKPATGSETTTTAIATTTTTTSTTTILFSFSIIKRQQVKDNKALRWLNHWSEAQLLTRESIVKREILVFNSLFFSRSVSLCFTPRHQNTKRGLFLIVLGFCFLLNFLRWNLWTLIVNWKKTHMAVNIFDSSSPVCRGQWAPSSSSFSTQSLCGFNLSTHGFLFFGGVGREGGGGEKEKLTLKKLRGIMFCLQTKEEKKGMYIY